MCSASEGTCGRFLSPVWEPSSSRAPPERAVVCPAATTKLDSAAGHVPSTTQAPARLSVPCTRSLRGLPGVCTSGGPAPGNTAQNTQPRSQRAIAGLCRVAAFGVSAHASTAPRTRSRVVVDSTRGRRWGPTKGGHVPDGARKAPPLVARATPHAELSSRRPFLPTRSPPMARQARTRLYGSRALLLRDGWRQDQLRKG